MRFEPENPAYYAPSWLGAVERVEDGERYLYEQSYDAQADEIIFSRIRYEDGQVVARTVYDGRSGEQKSGYEEHEKEG